MSYLLAKLSQCILNSTNGLVVNEVYVLVLLLQILQKSIVTFAIIYKFGGYKEKGSKRGGNLKNGTLRISRFLLLAYLSFLHTYYYIAHMA